MSGIGNANISNALEGLNGQNQCLPRKIPHGSAYEVSCTAGVIHHNTNRIHSIAKVISYPDGLVVGCTFLTNEAVEFLYTLHKGYLDRREYIHQSGE